MTREELTTEQQERLRKLFDDIRAHLIMKYEITTDDLLVEYMESDMYLEDTKEVINEFMDKEFS